MSVWLRAIAWGHYRFWLIAVLLIVWSGVLAGCGRIQQEPTEKADGLSLDLTLTPEQPAVGPATLLFTLTDQTGQPIDKAEIEVEGNMTHAGMVPVAGRATPEGQGRYSVPFEWTMGGDWFLTVEITLADGTQAVREIPVSVSGATARQ